MDSVKKIKLGISSCLLGNKVRYDGQDKLNKYLRDTLGAFVEWVPVCPEAEAGFGIPREAMRLQGSPENPELITIKTRISKTEEMLNWALKKLAELEKEDLCGFIFKSKSPSSGMKNVKVYPANGGPPVKKGSGIFAAAFMKRYPLLPVEEDERLNDPCIRENFMDRIFTLARWKEFAADPELNIKKLMDFHADHKLLMMSHSPSVQKKLGLMLGTEKFSDKLVKEYFELMTEGLSRKSSRAKNVNVLQHAAGYFRGVLDAAERSEIHELIKSYEQGILPLSAVQPLIRHQINKYDIKYLARQYFFNPYPAELGLRNYI